MSAQLVDMWVLLGWTPAFWRVQVYLVLLCFASLSSQVLYVLQTKGKTLHQRKDHNSLYWGGLELNLCYLWGIRLYNWGGQK